MAASPMLARPFPLCTGLSTLTARRALTPRMARFTFHAPVFADLGVEEPGEVITLGWCDPGEELALPEQGWRFPAGRPEQHWRNFTVRAHRPEAAEIDVDFFLHGDNGRASAWAARARPGDTVGFAGPRLHWVPAEDADWTVLAADETGLPALLAILETLPPGTARSRSPRSTTTASARTSSPTPTSSWSGFRAAAARRARRPCSAGAAAALELPDGARAGVGRGRGARDARVPRGAARGRPAARVDGGDRVLEAPPDAGRRRLLIT